MHTEYFYIAMWVVTGGIGVVSGFVGLSATKRRMARGADSTVHRQNKIPLGAR